MRYSSGNNWRLRIGMMGALLVFSISRFLISTAGAQDDPEYRMEVGGSLGTVNYLGDFNSSLTAQMQPMGALLAKYRPNPRMSWAFSISYGNLKCNVHDEKTWYPEQSEMPMPDTFESGLIDAGFRFEYNFWAYGTGREYYGAKPLAPFISLGLGATHASTSNGGVFAINMPLGAGVKYKIADRLNLTAEWRVHFTGSDKLDGIVDPYTIRSSGLFKNTDCYSVLQFSLTYDIWAKCKTCNNDRD